MSFRYDLNIKSNYLLAKTFGECKTVNEIVGYSSQMFQACLDKSLYKVLIDNRELLISTSDWENYQIAAKNYETRKEFGYIKTALIENEVNYDKMKTMETLFVNREFDLKVFKDENDAKQWLLSD